MRVPYHLYIREIVTVKETRIIRLAYDHVYNFINVSTSRDFVQNAIIASKRH